MAQPPMRCTSAIRLDTLAPKSVQTTSSFTARAGITRPTSAVLGSAVRVRMDSAPASRTIGTSVSDSDSATGYGLEPGRSPGGGRTDGDGVTAMATTTTITITIT